MADRTPNTTRMILYGAARVLGCGSVQLLLADEKRESLVFTANITNRELPRLEKVENYMGFPLDGARLPLSERQSMLVRVVHESKLLVTHDVAELAGAILPADIVDAIRQTIGPRTFAAAPIITHTGVVGVLLVEKSDESELSVEDRDILLAYADRVGSDLESQALTQEVKRLELLAVEDVRPELFACSVDLEILSGPHVGRRLDELFTLPGLAEVLRGATLPYTGQINTQERPLQVTAAQGPNQTLLVVVEDVRERQKLQQEVARARDHLAKVLLSVDDGIVTLDTDGQITSVNDAFVRMSGYEEAELIGQPGWALCADERSGERAREMHLRLRSSGFSEAELRLRKKVGERFSAEVSALLLGDDEERHAGAMWRVFDRSEKRRGEVERQRLKERLLHAERLSALGEMAARIAHEVRNPLVSIAAAAQVVAEELPADSPLAHEVRAIEKEVLRLNGIVGDFLRFARPAEPAQKRVDLTTVVEETVELVRRKVPERAIRVSADAPLWARCDPDGIKQVLLNLVLNAVECSPTGEVECEAHRVGDLIELSVADRGPGIPPSVRGKVFDPFFSTKTRGTGLGLAISKQIVDEHRGRIRLIGRREGGTRVVVDLPGA